MAFFDWLFGEDKPTTTTTQQIPAYLEQAGQQTVSEAQRLAGQPYQAYPGSRQAPLSPYFGQAGQLFEQAGMPVSPGEISQYTNPYIGQVIGQAARELQRTSDIQGQQIGDQAQFTGAFGGGRQGVLEAEHMRNTQQALGDLYERGYSGAYDRALAQANIGRQQQLQSGAAQMGIGQYMQQYAQQGLNIPYEDWQRQQMYPYTQLGFMSNILQGVPYAVSQYTQQPQQGVLGPAIGTALGIGSLFY